MRINDFLFQRRQEREMWADTILILVISVCTALLGEVRRDRIILVSNGKHELTRASPGSSYTELRNTRNSRQR